jgi:hypothetical protein
MIMEKCKRKFKMINKPWFYDLEYLCSYAMNLSKIIN